MIAQEKHLQSPEVLPVKVLGRFVDIFLTVHPLSGDTEQTFRYLYSGVKAYDKSRPLSAAESFSRPLDPAVLTLHLFCFPPM